jgi:hypothetical protein
MMKLSTVGYCAGAALAGAGLILTRRSPRTGGAMMVAGVAGLGLTAGAHHRHVVDPPLPAGYDPLDTLKPLADRIWTVDSGPLQGLMPLRMTVILLPDDSLLLHSPTRLTPKLQAELTALGPVRALVAPSPAHWMFARDWQRAYPKAETWAAPGLAERKPVQKSGLVIDHELSGTPPMAWGGAIDLVTVRGGFGFSEIALFHKPSRTLVLTDLVMNIETERLPALMRPFARLLGVTAPVGRAPAYVRTLFKLGGWAARDAAARLVALRPDHVVFAHGRPFEGNAADALAQSLAWLVPADRSPQSHASSLVERR